MAIVSDNPVVLPPEPAKTFDKWWIKSIVVFGADPAKPVTAQAIFDRYNGSELLNTPKVYDCHDLFTLAGTNQDVANAMNALMSVLEALAKADGTIE